ncbi:hypothetical protein [Tannockella kyphosi]|uniref:hypothetical protein n=1 Tax=Tannockella kyphosi TaxID=2899121 RepID=UPI002013ADB4|nr:hypothetical protein [Tannockella kyphosi]
MCIKMKAKNNEYTFIMEENISFSSLLNKFESLLDQSIFQDIVIYPQAFFDFQNRVVNNEEIEKLVQLLLEKQVLLFGGIVGCDKSKRTVQVKEVDIHGGQSEVFYQETLLIGNVKPGAMIECCQDIYILGDMSGTIVSHNENIKVYCQSIKNGNIHINNSCLQNITSFEATKVYYQDNEIKWCKGDISYVKNCGSNFG